MTITGCAPIIQAPAHELDQLNTVVMRCKRIAGKLGQQFAVTTVEQALFYKLIRLLNNACRGTVYLNELHQLRQDVRGEFEVGNFGIKSSSPCFNQVDPNQVSCSYRKRVLLDISERPIWNVWVLVQLVPQMTAP